MAQRTGVMRGLDGCEASGVVVGEEQGEEPVVSLVRVRVSVRVRVRVTVGVRVRVRVRVRVTSP